MENGKVNLKTPHRNPEYQKAKIHMPFWLKVLAFGYLVLSWFGWLRLQQTVSGWELLKKYMDEAFLPYLAVSGAAWGLLGLISALSLWLRWRFTSALVRGSALVLFAWYWLDRLPSANKGASSNLVFAMTVSIVLLAFALAVPALPQVKRFFLSRPKHK